MTELATDSVVPAVHFTATLRPYRSLSPRGFRWVIGAAIAGNLAWQTQGFSGSSLQQHFSQLRERGQIHLRSDLAVFLRVFGVVRVNDGTRIVVDELPHQRSLFALRVRGVQLQLGVVGHS